jgi:hypothetical protein
MELIFTSALHKEVMIKHVAYYEKKNKKLPYLICVLLDDLGFHGGYSPEQWPFPPLNSTWYMVRRAFLDGTTAYYGSASANIGVSANISLYITGLAVSGMFIF